MLCAASVRIGGSRRRSGPCSTARPGGSRADAFTRGLSPSATGALVAGAASDRARALERPASRSRSSAATATRTSGRASSRSARAATVDLDGLRVELDAAGLVDAAPATTRATPRGSGRPASAPRATARALAGTSSTASMTPTGERAHGLGRRRPHETGRALRRRPRTVTSPAASGSLREEAERARDDDLGSSRANTRSRSGRSRDAAGGLDARAGIRRDGAPRRALVDAAGAASPPRPAEVGRGVASVAPSSVLGQARTVSGSRRSCVLNRRSVVACVAAGAALLVAVRIRFGRHLSARLLSAKLRPGTSGTRRGRKQSAGSQLVQPGAAVRRPDPELRHGHRRDRCRPSSRRTSSASAGSSPVSTFSPPGHPGVADRA